MAALSDANAQDNPVARQGSTNADRFSIWLADLESIRRERPVVSPSAFKAQRVIPQAPPATGQGAARSASHGDTTVTSAGNGPAVVVLDDDGAAGHGGHGGGGGGSVAALRVFYGQQGAEPARADEMVRYQDHSLARQNKYPSRKNGLGFDMAQLRRDKAWPETVRTPQDIQTSWDHGMFMRKPPLGFDEAVSRNWVNDSSPTSLLLGFPLLGDVVFFRPTNHGGARSACFFKALAYLVYGDQSLYSRVQAEHLQHYTDVLEWEDHPRHQLYTRMNQKFYDTIISTDATNSLDREVNTVANFFQLLSIPQIWMPLDMLDVTADLYNLFIVVFTIVESTTLLQPQVIQVSAKGFYNSRHVFLLFNGFHYQPMVPNEYLASEFTFPRLTYENIKGHPSSGHTGGGRSSVDLRWRNTWGPGLDRRKGALPVDHVFYRESLRTAMTGSYLQQ